ncbi:MAG: hypothetical protein ACR2MG_13360, partial [Pyrinomonadaceae bacterium]
HESLFKKLARIVEYAEIKDVRLQIVFCKDNFLRLISTQDSGLVSNLFVEIQEASEPNFYRIIQL